MLPLVRDGETEEDVLKFLNRFVTDATGDMNEMTSVVM